MASAYWGAVKMVNPRTGVPVLTTVGPCNTEAEWFQEAATETGTPMGPWHLNTTDRTVATQALRLKLKGQGVSLEQTIFNRFKHQKMGFTPQQPAYHPITQPQVDQKLKDLKL